MLGAGGNHAGAFGPPYSAAASGAGFEHFGRGDMRQTTLLMMVVTGTLAAGGGYANAGVIDHETFKGTFAFANFSIKSTTSATAPAPRRWR